MMNKLEEAIIYATVMHQGKMRKLGSIPYILHPMEVAQILSTMTDDQDVITAGILHDVVEDTDGTLVEIEKRFGERVAFLVSSESENKYEGESRSEGCKHIGRGAKGDVYRYDDELIVKVYNENNTYHDVEQEIAMARKAFILGIQYPFQNGLLTLERRFLKTP